MFLYLQDSYQSHKAHKFALWWYVRYHASSHVRPFQKRSCIFFLQNQNSFPSTGLHFLWLVDCRHGGVCNVFGVLVLDAELWGLYGGVQPRIRLEHDPAFRGICPDPCRKRTAWTASGLDGGPLRTTPDCQCRPFDARFRTALADTG